jgi:hypothetical protein
LPRLNPPGVPAEDTDMESAEDFIPICSHCGRQARTAEKAGARAYLCEVCLSGNRSLDFIGHSAEVGNAIARLIEEFEVPTLMIPSAVSGIALENADLVLLGFATLGTGAKIESFTNRLRDAVLVWATMDAQILLAGIRRQGMPTRTEIETAAHLLMDSMNSAIDALNRLPSWRRARIEHAQHA